MSQNREQWGSKLGFILAATGSAVGIGNIWKYPSIAGQNGGGAFTLVYLVCIFIVGLSIVVAEFVIGRKTQLSPVGAFEKLAPNSNWKWVAFLGVASAFVILGSYFGIDATQKTKEEGFERVIQEEVKVDDDTKKMVDSKWSSYGL